MKKYIIIFLLNLIFCNKSIFSMHEYSVNMSVNEFDSKYRQEAIYEKKDILRKLLVKINHIKKIRNELKNKLTDARAWLKLQKDLKKDNKFLRTSNDLGGFQEGEDFRKQLHGYKDILINCEKNLSILPRINKELEKKIRNMLDDLEIN